MLGTLKLIHFGARLLKLLVRGNQLLLRIHDRVLYTLQGGFQLGKFKTSFLSRFAGLCGTLNKLFKLPVLNNLLMRYKLTLGFLLLTTLR